MPQFKDRGHAIGYAGFQQGSQCVEDVPPPTKSRALVQATRDLSRSLSSSMFPSSSLHHREPHDSAWRAHGAAIGVDATVGTPTHHRRRGSIPGYEGFTRYLDTLLLQKLSMYPRVGDKGFR